MSKKQDDLTNIPAYNIAKNYMQYEQNKSQKKQKKKELKLQKENSKIEERKKKMDHTKKLLEDASFSEMTTQQKIWSGLRLVFYAGGPFFVYMVMPAIIIAIGTILFSGSVTNVDVAYSTTASNFYTFVGIICALLYLFISAKKRGSKVSEDITFSLSDVNWKYIGLMFAFGFCASMFISSVYTLLPDSIMARYDSYTLDPYHTYDVALLMISLVLLDPIAEEIVFRGYMLNRLLPQLGEKVAIWIVTIIFALCHLSLFWIIYGIAFGWILAKISIRHDNIMYSIALHIGFNLPTLFNYWIMNNEQMNEMLFGSKLLIGLYAAFFGVIAYWLAIYYNDLENTGIDLKPKFLRNK